MRRHTATVGPASGLCGSKKPSAKASGAHPRLKQLPDPPDGRRIVPKVKHELLAPGDSLKQNAIPLP